MKNTNKQTLVLFDFDGTLVDSWPALHLSIEHVFKQHFPEKSTQHLRQLRQLTCNMQQCYTLAFYNHRKLEKMIAQVQQVYLHQFINNTNLYEDIDDLVDLLNRLNITWGIVTSKPKRFVEKIIVKHKTLQSSQVLICKEDVKKSKPEPEGILKAISVFKKKYNQIYYIGDSEVDMIAAQKANVRSIYAEYGYTDLAINQYNISFIAKKPRDIINYFIQNIS